MKIRLSKTHQRVLEQFTDKETIVHTRWVKGARGGGDANPQAYSFLTLKRLIRVIHSNLVPKLKHRTSPRLAATKYTTTTTYQITQRGKELLRNLTNKR